MFKHLFCTLLIALLYLGMGSVHSQTPDLYYQAHKSQMTAQFWVELDEQTFVLYRHFFEESPDLPLLLKKDKRLQAYVNEERFRLEIHCPIEFSMQAVRDFYYSAGITSKLLVLPALN